MGDRKSSGNTENTALERLKALHAELEISDEAYEVMRRELEAHGAEAPPAAPAPARRKWTFPWEFAASLLAVGFVLYGYLIYIIPKLQETYLRLHKEMPSLPRLAQGLSDLAVHKFYPRGLGVAVLVYIGLVGANMAMSSMPLVQRFFARAFCLGILAIIILSLMTSVGGFYSSILGLVGR